MEISGIRKLVPELSHGVVSVILGLAVIVQLRLVTDRRTDTSQCLTSRNTYDTFTV